MADGELAANPPWLARVETPGGVVLGAGFLVDEDAVLTCAHVVEPPSSTATEVAVCFIHSASAEPVPGRVSRSDYHPLSSPDDSVDLAIIRLLRARPPGTVLAPLGQPPSLAGHRLVLKGFPAGREWGDTVRALAVAEGGPRAGWWELHGEASKAGTWVDRGFSGGPVWSETAEAVVAVTVARWAAADARKSYAIPLVNVVEAYPGLDLRVVPLLDDGRAEDRLRRRLTALEEAHGPADARSISARYGLAQLLTQQGLRLDEAVGLLRRCLSDTDTGGHPAHRKVGMWWTLGETLMEQSRDQEALDCFDTAQRLAVAHSGSDDPRLSGLLAAKGLALLRLVRLPEAEEALHRSEELAGSAQPGEIARILHVRAMFAMTTDINEAERLAQECYDIMRQTFGSDHPAVVRPAVMLGGILVQQHSFPKARRLLEEALRIAESGYPSYHPQVAICRGAVANLELVEGKPETAFRVASRALEQAVAGFGDDDPRTAPYLIQMAYTRLGTGDASEAVRLADRAVQVAEQGAGSYERELGEALYARAETRAAQSDLAGALADAERGLGLTVQLHGRRSPVTAQPAALVAYLLAANGESRKGEELAQGVLRLVEGKGTMVLPIIAGCRSTLALAAAHQGRLDEAEEQYREAIRLWQSIHGSEHFLVGIRYVDLGVVQRRQLRFKDAERSISRGLDILTRTLPPHHPSLVHALRLAGPATRVRRFMGRLSR